MRVILAVVVVMALCGVALGSEETLQERIAELERRVAILRAERNPEDAEKERIRRRDYMFALARENPGLHKKVAYLNYTRAELRSPLLAHISGDFKGVTFISACKEPTFVAKRLPTTKDRFLSKKSLKSIREEVFSYRHYYNIFGDGKPVELKIDEWESIEGTNKEIGWGRDAAIILYKIITKVREGEVRKHMFHTNGMTCMESIVEWPGSRGALGNLSVESNIRDEKKKGYAIILGIKRILSHGAMDDGYYCLYREKYDDGDYILTRFSIDDSSVEWPLQWEKKAPAGEVWRGLLCDEGRITVFGVRKGKFFDTMFARVFMPDGDEVDRFPVNPTMFGGDDNPTFNDWYEYRGERYYRTGKPDIHADKPAREHFRDKTIRVWGKIAGEFKYDGHVAAVAELPGGGYAWIGMEEEENGVGFHLHYRDEKTAWKGRLGTAEDVAACVMTGRKVDPFSRTFSIAGVADDIYYSTVGGKVECVNRTDGKSKWIYVEPTVLFDAPRLAPYESYIRRNFGKFFAPESLLSFGPFFLDKVAAWEYEMRAEGISPLQVKGQTRLAVPVEIDSRADVRFKKYAVPGGIIAVLGPLAVLAGLWCAVRNIRFFECYILAVCAALLADYMLLRYFGAYHYGTTLLMYATILATFVCLAFGGPLRRRYGRKKSTPAV